MTARTPNLFIVGAAKAGTTAVHAACSQHPAIFCSPIKKEPMYFSIMAGLCPPFAGPGDASGPMNLEMAEYSLLYSKATGEPLVCDGSTWNLYVRGTAAKIYDFCPEAKIVIILRQPVKRAFSMFSHLRRDSREVELNFETAFHLSEERAKANWAPHWHYKQMGFYANSLGEYLDAFGDRAVFIRLHEDMETNPGRFYSELAEFLGVSPEPFARRGPRRNVSGIPKSTLLAPIYAWLKFDNPFKRLIKPLLGTSLRRRLKAEVLDRGAPLLLKRAKLDESVLKNLTRIYEEDIRRTSLIIRRDLGHWL